MRDLAEPLPSWGDADLAAVGSLLADPARCKVLLALDDGRALPASVLAEEAGVSRSTASSHLGKLTDAGMLRSRRTAGTATTGSPGPRSANFWSIWSGLPRPGPCSLREGTRAARLRPRVPATTIWQAGSASPSWAPCWTAVFSSAATDITTRSVTATTR